MAGPFPLFVRLAGFSLLLTLLAPEPVRAEPEDEGIPPRAQQRVTEAVRYEHSARRALEAGDLGRAETDALRALGLKRRALGARHSALGSAYFALADVQLARVATEGATRLARARHVPRQEEAYVVRLYSRAFELLSAEGKVADRHMAEAAAALCEIQGSFGVWHEAQRWAHRALEALGSPTSAEDHALVGRVLETAAGSGATNATCTDLILFFGLTPLRWGLAAHAERDLARVKKVPNQGPLVRARAMETTAALWFGNPQKEERIRTLLVGSLALHEEAGTLADRAHGLQAALLLAVFATDVGDAALWTGRCQRLLENDAGLDMETLKLRGSLVTVELPDFAKLRAKRGPADRRTWRAAHDLVRALCSGRIGPDPGEVTWPATCRSLAVRIARETATAVGSKDKLEQGLAQQSLALALMASGRFPAAAKAYGAARQALDGSADRSSRADVRSAMAYLACLDGRVPDALRLTEAAWGLRGKQKGLASPSAFRTAINLGYLREREGAAESAAAVHTLAIEAFIRGVAIRAPYDQERWRFASIEGVLLDMGRHEDLSRMTSMLSEAPPANSRRSPASLARYRGDFRLALLIERARLVNYEVRTAGTSTAAQNYDWALTRLRQARALLALGAEDEALADLLEAVASFDGGGRQRAIRAQCTPRRVLLLGYATLAEALLRRGSLKQALSLARRAHRLHVSYAHTPDRARTPLFDGRPERLVVADVLERGTALLAPLESHAPETYARALHATGASKQAVSVLEDALLSVEARLPAQHPRVGVALHAMARVLLGLGNASAARLAALRAESIFRASLSRGHPEHADVLLTLGDLALLAGKPGEALAPYAAARRSAQAALYPTHPLHALTRSGTGLALARMGESGKALAAMREALDLVARRTETRLAGATNHERLELLSSVQWILANWLEVTRRGGTVGYDEVLALRGRVARAMGLEARLLRGAEGRSRVLAEKLIQARKRLARLAYRAPRFGWARAPWRRQVAEATAAVSKLSRKLGSTYVALRRSRKAPAAKASALVKRLVKGEALVDVVLAGGRYVAWALVPGQPITRIELGLASILAPRIQAFRDAVLNADSSDDPTLRETGLALRAALWSKIEAALAEDTTLIYLVPDGALAAAPLEALPRVKGDGFLVDDTNLVRLPFPHMLLTTWAGPGRGTGALLVGDVNFEQAHREGATGTHAVTGRRRRRLRDRVPGLPRMPPLPGTRAEIDVVEKILVGAGTPFQPERLAQERATEGRVRKLAAGKRIVHFATHGIVREGLASRLRMPADSILRLRCGLERHVQGLDPMLMSGLALAGVNVRVSEGEDDGMLTSLEVLGLDLDGVALAFLSACDTAGGVEQAGEGTLGLVQAFTLAGARSVVASLWPVDDEATALLVRTFYEVHVKGKITVAEALRRAALALRAQPRYAAPRYWAAFGAYGPLR